MGDYEHLLRTPASSVIVTPHDSLAQDAPKGLHVGTGGNITGRLAGDTVDRVWKNILSGQYVPGNFTLVKATGTTATDIVGYGL